MKSYIGFFGLAIFLATVQLTAGQETLLVQHSGYNNPTTEGFSSSGTGQVGGVTNDLGNNAWATHWTYNSVAAYSTPIENIAGLDWILSVTVRVVATNGSAAGGGLFPSIRVLQALHILNLNSPQMQMAIKLF